MIRLKFTYNELLAFNQYLIDVIKSIKNQLVIDRNFSDRIRMNAELSEFNRCYLLVNKKVITASVMGRIQKKYTVSISYMQGFLISETYHINNELSPYINAVLTESTMTINKQLIS